MPISDARGAIAGAAATFRVYAGAPQRLGGTTVPVAGGVDMTFCEPIGVVGVITPWNFPLTIASWKIAPALAAGNAVIHKPSELTPLTAIELKRIVDEAGAPESLLTVLVGTGEDVGRRIVEHPGVGKITFTGSTAVGRQIAAAAARDVKRVTLELGGKSPSIVFDHDRVTAVHDEVEQHLLELGAVDEDGTVRAVPCLRRKEPPQLREVVSAHFMRLAG